MDQGGRLQGFILADGADWPTILIHDGQSAFKVEWPQKQDRVIGGAKAIAAG